MGPVTGRVEGWEQRLHALVNRHRRRPFLWGEHDCCAFVLAAVRACRGEHAAVEPYASQREALRVARAMGGLERAADTVVGNPLEHAALAQRGDVVMVSAPGPFGVALAVCMGPLAYVPGTVGLVPVPPAQWLRAWRV